MHGNVRKIRHDQVVSFSDFVQKIALEKLDSFGQPQPCRVFSGQGQRIARNVDTGYGCAWQLHRQAQSDHPAANSDVDNFQTGTLSVLCRALFTHLRQYPDQFLGLWARDHRSFVAAKSVSGKLDGAEQVLERLTFSATADQI